MMENKHNPGVNSFIQDNDYDADESLPRSEQETKPSTDGSDDSIQDVDSVPVPNDENPVYPVREPPEAEKPPIGDVDDSPKRIAE